MGEIPFLICLVALQEIAVTFAGKICHRDSERKLFLIFEYVKPGKTIF